jgi:hypothetical protein
VMVMVMVLVMVRVAISECDGDITLPTIHSESLRWY